MAKEFLLAHVNSALDVKQYFGNSLCTDDFICKSFLEKSIQTFNLYGKLSSAETQPTNFVDLLKSSSRSLNKDRVCAYLKDQANCSDLVNLMTFVRSQQDSFVNYIGLFFKLCGFSITQSTEMTRKNDLILAYSKAYVKTINVNVVYDVQAIIQQSIVTTRTTVPEDAMYLLTAELTFCIILLVQSFHKGQHDDGILFRDFCSRLGAIDVCGHACVVSETVAKDLFEISKSSDLFLDPEISQCSSSYLFTSSLQRVSLDWSFRDSETLVDDEAIFAHDAVYILREGYLSYCIPYKYFKMDVEDQHTNILHLFPTMDAMMVIIRFIEVHDKGDGALLDVKSSPPSVVVQSEVFFTSSVWMEFDNILVASEILDAVDHAAIRSNC
jgi:hypothetical protein